MSEVLAISDTPAFYETGLNHMNMKQLITQFNVYGIPDYDNAPVPYIGHIFMSRPSLELMSNLSAIQSNAQLHGALSTEFGRAIAPYLDRTSSVYWMPLITNRAKNYSVNDVELKNIEKGTTFYGHTITYSKHNEEHKFGGNLSMDFRNDRFLSILTMMHIWVFYINNVSKNDSIKVYPLYEERAILDYCASMYFVVTKTTNRQIVYWEKLTGVRPRKVPFSIFSWDDSTKVTDTISIDFEFGVRSDPMDPRVLADINAISAPDADTATSMMEHPRSSDFIRPKIQTNAVPILATKPFISARKYENGSIEYYLEFI